MKANYVCRFYYGISRFCFISFHKRYIIIFRSLAIFIQDVKKRRIDFFASFLLSFERE
jgi:hypothetical protein